MPRPDPASFALSVSSCLYVRLFRCADLIAVDSDDEEQRCVSPVDAFVVSIFEEAALRLVASQTLANDLALQRRLLGDRQVLVVLSETSLTLLVHLHTHEAADKRSTERESALVHQHPALSRPRFASSSCANHENEFDGHIGRDDGALVRCGWNENWMTVQGWTSRARVSLAVFLLCRCWSCVCCGRRRVRSEWGSLERGLVLEEP